MTRTLLLALHIASVAAWLGANFVQFVLSPRFARGPADIAAAWTRQTIWLGERYYSVVGALVAVSGVLLVLDGDWSWVTSNHSPVPSSLPTSARNSSNAFAAA